MKDDETKARDKFMEDVQELGFPVKIQGGKALQHRNQEPLSEQPTESTTFGPGGFMMRKPGMPFEEFKKACIKSLTEKGLFKHSEQRAAEQERLAKKNQA